MPVIAQGMVADPPFEALIEDGAGNPIDADALSLTLVIKTPLAVTIDTIPMSSMTHAALGIYTYAWLCPIGQTVGSGYTLNWHGTINSGASDINGVEDLEVVAAGTISFGPLTFLRSPEDTDAIRYLLGVTVLDIEDAVIESPPFGQQAERMVKARVSNWATQVTDVDLRFALRASSFYATAALLAESYVHGGMVGLLMPDLPPRDWEKLAEYLWNRYNYWLNIADASDVEGQNDSEFTIVGFKFGGQTRHRRAVGRGWGIRIPWWRDPDHLFDIGPDIPIIPQ